MELDETILHNIEDTRSKWEFMTFVVFDKDIVVGIIQNETSKLLMIYQFDLLRTKEEKELFLRYGDEWWWGSARGIPINLFIGDRFDQFEYCLKGYSRKSVNELIGPTFNLADKYLRRVRKKRIELYPIPPK